jgi:hypothetical protein
MNTRAKLRVVVTHLFKEKANERLGQNSLKFLTAYAEEQWRLGNIYRTRNGAAFMEMPPCVKNRHEVILGKV